MRPSRVLCLAERGMAGAMGGILRQVLGAERKRVCRRGQGSPAGGSEEEHRNVCCH